LYSTIATPCQSNVRNRRSDLSRRSGSIGVDSQYTLAPPDGGCSRRRR
jgi:hypothetical protein